MAEKAMAASIDSNTFDSQLEEALKAPSDQAAKAMLSRGRSISYRERDTPPGHVIREYPDGTKILVRIEVPASTKPA